MNIRLCPKCKRPMLERENDWYCLKDDVIIQKETIASVAFQPPVCSVCGQLMVLLDEPNQRWYCYRDDVSYYAKDSRWVGLPTATDTATYDAFYLDGYADTPSGDAVIEVFHDHLRLDLGEQKWQWEIPYDQIEVLNISHEREITALRTFLIGPVLAAAFKKGTLLLTLGFRDDKGLLQLPVFRMGEDTVYACYATLIQKIPNKNPGRSQV